MSYQIIVEFPDKKTGDDFCGQMCDGFGEGLCNFTPWRQKPNTDGTKNSHFEKMKDKEGREIWLVKDIFEN